MKTNVLSQISRSFIIELSEHELYSLLEYLRKIEDAGYPLEGTMLHIFENLCGLVVAGKHDEGDKS
ncbi:MAG: hypothetical protein LC650_00575 [Actinobacteria bacterium]|nr:hypothetical protein [Actinomycetota bacterium]